MMFVLLALMLSPANAQRFGFAVYDVDRLYDTLPSLFYDDSDYTPDGRLKWNSGRYERKVAAVAAVLDSMALPVVALCGVENENVVRDIVSRCKCDYSYIHRTLDAYDGLDLALLYFGDMLFPSNVGAGRGLLAVEAVVQDAEYAFVVCRRPQELAGVVGELRRKKPGMRIVAAGDLRDTNLESLGLRDATSDLAAEGRGNALFSNGWKMADRIAVDRDAECECSVFVRRWLLDRRGAPAPTYEGARYRGGAGRRLPVCCFTGAGNLHNQNIKK